MLVVLLQGHLLRGCRVLMQVDNDVMAAFQQVISDDRPFLERLKIMSQFATAWADVRTVVAVVESEC